MTVKLARRPVVIAVAVAGLAVTGAGVAQASSPGLGPDLHGLHAQQRRDAEVDSTHPSAITTPWPLFRLGDPGHLEPEGPAGHPGTNRPRRADRGNRTDRVRRADRGSGTLRACRSTGTIRAQG
jgi:hypothetical protein